MKYEPVDRIPFIPLEPFETTTLQRWAGEAGVSKLDLKEHFGIGERVSVPINFDPMPAFEQKILEENDEYVVFVDAMGSTVRAHRDKPGTYYGHVDFPVKTPADWEAYKERFVPDLNLRLPADWGKQKIEELNSSDNPVGIYLYPFFFRLGFYTLGMERFLMAFYEEPKLIHDMFSFYGDYVFQLIKPILETVKIDILAFAEDLAFKNSTHFSPAIYIEFWAPYQQKIIDLARQRQVPVICMWSAGNVEPLLPTLLEQGFNCTWPLEVQAGMDAQSLRRRYGKNLLLGGNFAKEALLGGRAEIDREIERLAPFVREGGFIPALDDMVPENTPLEDYQYLIESFQRL